MPHPLFASDRLDVSWQSPGLRGDPGAIAIQVDSTSDPGSNGAEMDISAMKNKDFASE